MTIWNFLIPAILGLVLWFILEKRKRRTSSVTGGLHEEITLPYEEEFELYHNAFSHCSRKTRLVMAELGNPYKSHPIDLIECGSYENIGRRYLAINPSGLVPTLVHKGHPVYESDDILSYAAAHAGDNAPSLVPGVAEDVDVMNQWIKRATLTSGNPMAGMEKGAGACIPALTIPLFFTAIRYIPFRNIFEGFLFHPDKKRPVFFTLFKMRGINNMMKIPPLAKLLRKGRLEMIKHLDELNQRLTNHGPWIMGAQYTLADVSWTAILLRIDEADWLDRFVAENGLDAVADYYTRIKERPSWNLAITEQSHFTIERAVKDLRAAKAANDELTAAMWS